MKDQLEQLEQPIDYINQIYQIAVDYLVGYSFQLVGAILVIIAGIIVARWVSTFLLKVLEKRNVDITLRQFIASTVRLILMTMFVIIALSQLGISITPLIAAIGGVAVGLSLALQGPVSNYGAGLMIILTRMYRVGDTISTQDRQGIVEDISLAATQLRAEDGELITIPNKHIMGEIHSNSEANRIVEGEIGIAYAEDPNKAIGVIEKILTELPGVANDTTPEVGISSFGDSSVNIEYRYWTPSGGYYQTIHAVNLAIFEQFRTEGISIPFPQHEVRFLNQPPG